MMSFNYWIEDTTTGGIKFKVNTLLPFEYQLYSISKVEGYEPESSEPTNASPASTEPTVTIEDMGTWYKMSVVNETGDTLSDYWVEYTPTSSLSLTSTSDSLRIVQIDHGVSFEPYKDLFENCVAYWDFMGDAKDVMGNYDGIITGDVSTTSDKFGIVDGGYYFGGTNSVIYTSDIGVLNDGTCTIRFKCPSPNDPSALVQNENIIVYHSLTSGYLRILLFDNRNGTGDYHQLDSSLDVFDNSYHTLSVLWDSSENITLVVDGQVDTSTSSATGLSNCDHAYSRIFSWKYTCAGEDIYRRTLGTCDFVKIDSEADLQKTLLMHTLFDNCYPYPIMTDTVGGLLE
jgi:hypothetical protein